MLFVLFSYANLHYFLPPCLIDLPRLEAFARICVSGFLLDPEVSFSTLFISPFSSYHDPPNVPVNSAPSRQPSLRSQNSSSHGLSFTQHIHIFRHNIARPFILSNPSSQSYDHAQPPSSRDPLGASSTTEKLTAAGHNFPLIRNHSQPTNILKSDRTDVIALPFQLTITQAHDKMRRNVPYLRQSWGRIDFIAIVSFWITFVLATVGVERGTYHIGIFRALSVLRTAHLLTITSGTTVSTYFFRRGVEEILF